MRITSRIAAVLILIAPLGLSCAARAAGKEPQQPLPQIRVGSKQFTESVVLGEILRLLIASAGYPVQHRAELGGTRILWNALIAGELDLYPEYSGTIVQELLPPGTPMHDGLKQRGIRVSGPLGFNNTYALGMKRSEATRLGIRSISDLSRYPALKFGFSSEFLQRTDGWPRIQQAYHLSRNDARGLDHDVAYRALESGDIDLVDLYSTDAEIRYYDIQVLEDDLRIFPKYEAVILFRSDLENRAPEVIQALKKMEGKITEQEMIAMNARAKLDRVPEAQVASDFIQKQLGLQASDVRESSLQRISRHLREHLHLVFRSLIAAILFSVPLGILAAYHPTLGQVILGAASIIQTIPALALLVLLIRPLKALGLAGIGDTPAMIALFLYSLLPIIRNTAVGIREIPPQIRESAEALGLPGWTRLRIIELPLAFPLILAGIKTAAVLNVGFATLGALIGAGGFGQPILTGIRLDNTSLIMEGAVPAALLALVTQLLFELIGRRS